MSRLDGVEVHLIQMRVEKGRIQKNIDRAVQLTEMAIKGSVGIHEVDIVGLPETFATGFPDLYPVDLDQWRKWGEPVPDQPGASVDDCPTLKRISEACGRTRNLHPSGNGNRG